MPPKGPTKALGSRIPEDLHTRARLFCVKSGCTLEGFVADAIKEKLDREETAGGVDASANTRIQSVKPFKRKVPT